MVKRTNATGSISRKGKRWRVRIVKDGVQRQAGTYPSKRAAEAALTELLAEHNKGRLVLKADGAINVTKWVTDWVATNTRITSPRTIEVYRSLIKNHIDPQIGHLSIADLSPAAVRMWFHERHGESPTQAAKAYRLLRAALNTATQDGMIRANPCQLSGAGVERPEERPVVTPEQVVRLADAMPAHLRAAVVTMAYASLRFGEMAGLRRADVDVVGRVIHVRRQTGQTTKGIVDRAPKNGSARTVHIPQVLCEILAAHMLEFTLDHPDARVFTGEKGGPVTQQVWRGPWREARAAMGLEGFHTHDLRHSGNTWAAQTGASTKDLMERMGHASVEAALRYQHSTELAQRSIAAGLDALVQTPGG